MKIHLILTINSCFLAFDFYNQQNYISYPQTVSISYLLPYLFTTHFEQLLNSCLLDYLYTLSYSPTLFNVHYTGTGNSSHETVFCLKLLSVFTLKVNGEDYYIFNKMF